jgi:hypothetical protein
MLDRFFLQHFHHWDRKKFEIRKQFLFFFHHIPIHSYLLILLKYKNKVF